MKDKTYHAYLDSHERQLVIHSLVSQGVFLCDGYCCGNKNEYQSDV